MRESMREPTLLFREQQTFTKVGRVRQGHPETQNKAA